LCEQDAAQLDQLDASKLMPEFSPEPLPRLSALIGLLDSLNLGLNLEIKPRSGLEAPTVDAICDVLDQLWPERLPLVFSSFNQKSLQLAQTRSPSIARALLIGGLPKDWQAQMIQFDCCNLHAHEARLDEQTVDTIKATDVGLYAYTVNDPERATTLLNWGVDGVFTDHPQQMLKYQLA
jgi:glycerophosphoryl diester phosphodiesterase